MSRARERAVEALRFALPVLVFLAGIGGFVHLSNSRQSPARMEQETPKPLVETVKVRPHEEGLNFRIDGVVVPARDIQLTAEVDGRVTHKAPQCRAGNFVAAGTLLYRIDPRDFELERRRLRQELQQAEVKIEEVDVEIKSTELLIALAKQELELRHRELARLQRLSAAAQAASQIDEARRSVLAAENSLQTLENQLALLKTRRVWQESALHLTQTQLERAELDLSRTEIKAPVAGVIISDQVEQDAYVRRGDPLAVVEDTSQVEVRTSLRMEQLAWLWRQSPVHAAGASAPADETAWPDSATWGRSYRLPKTPVSVVYKLGGIEHVWTGVLDRFDGLGLDERTRTVPTRVVVENPRRATQRRAGDKAPAAHIPVPALVRGMFVSVEVHAQPQATLLAVPEAAIRPGNKLWCVRDARLVILDAQVAAIVNDTAVIDADACPLQAGDQVITSPLAVPVEGMEVKVANGANRTARSGRPG